MIRIGYCVLLTIALSGCAGGFTPRDYSFFTVDLKNRTLCQGSEDNGMHCYALSLIVPSYNEIHIARAYGINPTKTQWSTNDFIDVLLKPENGLYQSERVSKTAFRIPNIEATRTAYYYIKQEYHQLYESKRRR